MTRTTREKAPLLETFALYQRKDVWTTTHDLTCNRLIYATFLLRCGVSNLKPTGSEAETLPLRHRAGLLISKVTINFGMSKEVTSSAEDTAADPQLEESKLRKQRQEERFLTERIYISQLRQLAPEFPQGYSKFPHTRYTGDWQNSC
ncbi:hypothetical protein AVEN_65746-1 [Araneus ventricosus]|uniref:Uncharacterized protein n=1 Tax=Araneus ventricosus TaxID=182803 RepID=A0A4Y2T2C1_ARAVE|nr:hypothetical protein AVEN_65746-1 [Araneus ventricosus]